MSAVASSVVLVDDAVEVRMLLRAALRSSGRYTVVGEGSNGAEAIELAQAHRPDVVILDVSMPVLDGLEALPRILAVSPGTRVVMYTGFDEHGLAERAVALGATALLQKSLKVERFAIDLDAALGASAPEQPDPAQLQRELPSELDVTVLDEHLERFRAVFEQAAIGMGTMTLAGRLVRANPALARMVGRDVDELVGMPYIDLATPRWADSLRAALTAHINGDDVVDVEHDVRVGAGVRRVATSIAVARDTRQRPLYLFLQVQNITAQRAAEAALRTSEERLGLLVDAVEDYAIFMLDPDGHIVSWNSGAQRIKGYAAGEIIGQHFRVFYPMDKQLSRHPEHELEIARVEGSYEEEGWRVRKDGSMFWANVLISAVRNEAGEHIGFAKVTRDVTERRNMLEVQERARSELAVANRRLEEANRRLAQSSADQAQFLAVTSHELRSPIGVLTGASSMLVDNWDALTPDERASMVEAMKNAGARLNRLLTDLLTTSRLESGGADLRFVPVDLSALLERVRAALSQSHPGVELTVQCEPALVLVADADRLSQIIENLVLNALRHGAAPVHVQAVEHDDVAEIRVSDAGNGVPPELQDRLFERFVTGRKPGGTGLGLFIVREFARAHHGEVTYEPGPRPTFVVTLPLRVAVP